ncbi:MAG: 4-hydroxy-tetrahydrodipicolinate synthase [Gammaproteobacteria bacterium]|nr:4-hydroxy-tetrahydrodipicolinate synthase [Gammaproteobacteria bacterium]
MKEGVSPDTAVDMEGLARLIEFHIENGTDAIVAVGTTGESATLPEAEHCSVLQQIVEFAAGRISVIAGTGANSTNEAISLTQCAKKAGADACLLVTPYYNKPTQEGLFQHYKAVAEAVNISQILYNVPSRTACDLLPETVGRLAKIENIIGIKEATAELDRLQIIRSLCGDDFLLVSGDDATACEFMLLGGDGVISVTANVAPDAMHKMSHLAVNGHKEAAYEINNRLKLLHQALFLESNPIPVKWAVHRLNLIEAGIRLPMTWMSNKYELELEAAMQVAGVL